MISSLHSFCGLKEHFQICPFSFQSVMMWFVEGGGNNPWGFYNEGGRLRRGEKDEVNRK